MPLQDFIFSPGIWLGEGKITFSSSSEFIKFYTKWEVSEEQHGIMKAIQVVEMQGVEKQVINDFTFSNINPTSFSVLLENETIGGVMGSGLRDEKKIAWEFVGESAFEGFEVYEKQDNEDYFFHGEYGSQEQYRTIVEGLIWRKE